MSTLIDTNVLLRQFEPAHVQHAVAVGATLRLLESGELLLVGAQNLGEFWAAATRQPPQGLGLDFATAQAGLGHIEQIFQLLPDDPAIYEEWRRLVTEQRVTGLKAWDVRLLAVMRVHDVARILTFDRAFPDYGVEVLDPMVVT